MRPKISFAWVFFIFFLTATPALGYQLTFHPRISVGVEYTDNVFLEPDNVEEIPGRPAYEPESDFLFITAPGFTTEILGQQKGLSLSYDFGYSKYNEFSSRDSWRHNLDFSTWTEFARNMRLEFRDTFLYTEDPLGGRAFEVTVPPDSGTPADPTTVRSREPYWVNTASLRFDHDFGQRKSYFFEFSNTIREDDDIRGNSSTEYTPRAGLTYWFGPDWGTEIEGAYSWGDFDNAPDIDAWYGSLRVIRRMSRQLEVYGQYRNRFVNQEGDLRDYLLTTRRTLEDYKVHDLQLGTIYSISNDLTLEASGGVVYYDPDITDDQTGFSGTLDLSKTFRRGSVRIYGFSGYNENLFTRSDLGPSLAHEAGLSGNYQLVRDVTLNAFISYRRDDYGDDQRVLLAGEIDPDLPPIPEEDLNRTDDSYGAGAGLAYALRSWVSFNLNYSYFKRESNQERQNYDENRATFYITFTTPRPYQTSR